MDCAGDMSDQDDAQNGLKLADRATLSLLAALEGDEPVTQRGLASRIGVALGLTNSLLKRAVHKGLVKVSQAPAKRYVYYVTPKGFSEKSRLVAEYLGSSLTFFRQARGEYVELYQQIQARGHKRIALFGAGELAEIAILSAAEAEAELCGVVHPGSNLHRFSGLPVFSSVDAVSGADIDAIIITNAERPQEIYDDLSRQFGSGRVFAAPLLHVSRNGNGGRE